MRIAIVAPLFFPIPPKGYGGTERVVQYLVEDLVKLGHTVTVYGVAGSETPARLITTLPEEFGDAGLPIPPDEEVSDIIATHFVNQMFRVLSDAAEYDVIHFHHELYPFHGDFFRSIPRKLGQLPIVWTDHTHLDLREKDQTLKLMNTRVDIHLTTLSEAQHRLNPAISRIGIVHNGIPEDLIHPVVGAKPSYLAFLGRITDYKGAPHAVRIAAASGIPMRMAGTFQPDGQKYYDEMLDLMGKNDIKLIGEINDQQKSGFLSNAIALLFPIQWEEPFGLVMIEAMACGTPVIAFRRASVPEVVDDGVTGFIVDTEEEAVEKLKIIDQLDRKKVRQVFEQRFTAKKMAQNYAEVYEKVCSQVKGKSMREGNKLRTDDIVETTMESSRTISPV